jgi:hypothetical protein
MMTDDEFVDKAMMKVMRKKENLTATFNRVSVPVTEENLRACLIIMAGMVNRYGETYLPIFIRIKEELERIKSTQSMLDLAAEIENKSTKNAVQNTTQNAQHKKE